MILTTEGAILELVEEFKKVFNAVPVDGKERRMIETLGAKNKGKTKDGSKDRWGIMVNGQWRNTINAQHGEVIDGLEKGDQIEVSLVERGAYKNVDSIEKVTDVNEDVKSEEQPVPKKSYKKTGESRNGSFALSYAKDFAVTIMQVTGDPSQTNAQDILAMADVFKGWLDNA